MSAQWANQLVLLPILLPLLCGSLLILIDERRQGLKFTINLASTLGLLLVAALLMRVTDTAEAHIAVHLAANWPAPFGIALVADRLSAVMLLLTSLLALASLVFSSSLWSRVGVHFHPLFQYLLMGINGACLTGDIFNLFVFFEVMLAASYGLLLYSYNTARIRAGMQYIAINLVCSFFFLIGVALIYSAAGTLNMADLAVQVPHLAAADRQQLEIGAAILAIAFLTKSAAWPFCFWLPTTYATASPPVAAMLVLMTKMGVYVLLRLWLLVFSGDAAESSGFGGNALFWYGLATLTFGSIGLLASQELGRMAAYSAIISSGTLLASIGYGQPSLVGAALFYLISSTLAVAALLLLVELIDRVRNPGAAMLALTMEAFAVEDAPGESAGVAIPAAMAFLGLSFVACALIITGLPPLSGFVAKFGLLHALLNTPPDALAGEVTALSPLAWGLLALVIISGLVGIIALMRFGVRTFWAAGSTTVPRLQISEAAAVSSLLLLCVLITVQAAPVRAYLERTAEALHQPYLYVDRVFSAPVTAHQEDDH